MAVEDNPETPDIADSAAESKPSKQAKASTGTATADRIRDCAIDLFGEHGFSGTSVRQVAQAAHVSQALVIHHFGSKDGLRLACDQFVTDIVRGRHAPQAGEAFQLDPFQAIREFENSRPVLRYLARILAEGGPETNALVDSLVASTTEYVRRAEEQGFVKPSRAPRDRVALMVILSMGTLTMHKHLKRLLGADLLDNQAPVTDFKSYMVPLLELYSQGFVADGAFDHLIDSFTSDP